MLVSWVSSSRWRRAEAAYADVARHFCAVLVPSGLYLCCAGGPQAVQLLQGGRAGFSVSSEAGCVLGVPKLELGQPRPR